MTDRWAGVFGKYPLAGDFVARGLQQGLKRPLDRWITQNLARRETDWPEGGVRGVLELDGRTILLLALQSHDKPGRSFPLVCVANPARDHAEAEEWCEAVFPTMLAAVSGELDIEVLLATATAAAPETHASMQPAFWSIRSAPTGLVGDLFEST